MAIIRKKELRGMQEKELKERLKDLKLELLRMGAQKSQAKNIKLRETRRVIARVLTILNQNKKQQKEKR
jgi:large subunit ribosomal protein L29